MEPYGLVTGFLQVHPDRFLNIQLQNRKKDAQVGLETHSVHIVEISLPKDTQIYRAMEPYGLVTGFLQVHPDRFLNIQLQNRKKDAQVGSKLTASTLLRFVCPRTRRSTAQWSPTV